MNFLENVFAIFASFLYLLCSGKTNVFGESHGDIFTNCGGLYEEPKGVLSTPNFPGPYPTPLYCEWLIHAPNPGKKIVLYFTQNFMKDSIYISSYDHYQDINLYVGRTELGQIFWEHDLAFLVEYKPYILIQFSVESIGNRHLRVIDHLLDVYGFNITYEVVDKNENLIKNTCSVKTCSYLGNCIASADFSNYSCQCFDKFFGENCQYGPYCDPENGINLCSNGGLCKYFFGSLINQCECPDGFGGAYCERAAGESLNVTAMPEECLTLKCSHECEIDFTGQPKCYCPDGYSMDEDNLTCIPIDRYRFDVSLEFQKFINIPSISEVEKIKNQIRERLKSNGIKTVSDLEIHGFRNSTETTVLEFHFNCLVSEVNSVKDALKSLTDLGDLAGYRLKQTVPKYESNPELMLSEIMNYDPHPTLRGKMLTLVCAAKGSSKMKFRWFKDNVRVDTSLTLRNAWETIVPHTVHGMFLSVLNIDSVMPIDQGLFSCQVEDFGKSVVGSVDVTVNNYPRVQLDPMSLSVNKGQTVAFKCLSPDDSWQHFTYEWLKNGMKIAANSKSEYSEELYPTGVRLVVPEVKEHAEYTCKVTNEAGSANVSAFVYVIADNATAHFCSRSYVGEVVWLNTSGGHFDVQRCPTEQGGYARRHCECDASYRHCKWAEPNFSKCQSLRLIHTYDELELLRNGYQQTNLSDIFDDLYKFTLSKNKDAILFSGDVDMVAGILKELISHMKTFPQLVQRDKMKIEAGRLVDLLGEILHRSSMATPDEKSDILVGPSVVQTIHNLVTGAIEELQFSTPLKILSSVLDMIEETLTEVPCATCDTGYATKHQTEDTVLPMKVKTFTVRSRYLVDLLSYRDAINNKANRIEFTPVSAVYSVAHRNEDITNFRNPTARIVINHNTDAKVLRSNTTVCLKWAFDIRHIYSGMWTQEGCVTRESHRDRTVCECRLPGHFIAGMIPSNITDVSQIHLVNEISLPFIISYSVSLVLVIIACVVYIRTIRNLNIEIHTVHFSFVISIVLATAVRVICLIHVNASQVLTEVLGSTLTFSFYVAVTALSLEMFHLFVITYNIKLILMTKLKFIIVCWGIPFILMIPTIFVSKYLDNDDPYSCHAICWMYLGSRQLLVFVLILSLNLSIYILLLILCICSLRKWTEEWRYAEKQTYVKSILKNSILFLFLLLTIGSGVDLEPWSNMPHVACNITFQLSLCMLVLIIRCIINKHVRYLCIRICCGTPRRESTLKDQANYKSFRAFIEPTRVNNVVISQEEDNVSKYYDEVNRTKYTKERKRMLSSLLGSGSNGSGPESRRSASGGSTAETSVSYNSSSGGSKESTSPSLLMNFFSHSGTDCGILINEYSKSTSSVGASGSVKDDIQPALQTNDSNIIIDKRDKSKSVSSKCNKKKSNVIIEGKCKHTNPKLEVHSSAMNELSFTHIDHEFRNQPEDTHATESNNKQQSSKSISEPNNSHSNQYNIHHIPLIHGTPEKDFLCNQEDLSGHDDSCEEIDSLEGGADDNVRECCALLNHNEDDISDLEDDKSSCS
ncbi:adhesion G protein-coupled receptor L2-like isoform X2 [Mercenaria mercenaria]|uniref:adhesion G protein-coupled receptor L2-like isoform X2 n=1 Tax=Mercenaria mercenaria TaxID=6596 RepID=UPI00234F2F1C|nr:adhesion G protein-coupled receptor L2-like isoform X2 [Mercenaria mercenaria]